jgi:polysaccharide biosynthesis protein PslH
MTRHQGLRILLVTPGLSYPPSDGFSIRVTGLLRELARRHHVTLLTYDSAGGDSVALRDLGVDVHLVPRGDGRLQLWRWLSVASPRSFRSRYYYSAAMQQAIRAVLLADRFDVVQFESTELWAFDFRSPGSRHAVVLDAHNVFSELLKRITAHQESAPNRMYWALETAKFAREEKACWRRVDGCVLTSDREAAIVRATPGVRAATVVPNAVDVDHFRPATATVEAGEIVFSGLMSYHPNQDAVAYFVREILPYVLQRRRDAIFTVIGKEVPPSLAALAGPHVRFTGSVPDTRPYLARAAAVVVPLREGSGTRLKILEALAMAKGIVSTTIGCEGLDVTPGRELLVADKPGAIGDAVVRLLDHPREAAELGRRGRELVEESYGWPAAAMKLEEFYAQLGISA